MNHNSNKHLDFFISALNKEGYYIKTKNVISWLKERNEQTKVVVNKVRFKDLKEWSFVNGESKLSHSSGKFFSIIGIDVQTNFGSVPHWQQPIINQPEIGYLGFLTKKINGVLHFLVQAKIEPGNLNEVQLSPTLQATKSNYTQVHKGKKPLYLEYFSERGRCMVLLDQLQSEQGARFLQKRNRNIIVETTENIEVYDNFLWLTLGQIKDLAQYENLINMDTRTVISGIPFGNFDNVSTDFFRAININSNNIANKFLYSALSANSGINSYDDIIAWFTQLKCSYELTTNQIPLKGVNDWIIDEKQIFHKDEKYFKVIACNIEIGNREVTSWSQPMIEPCQHGLIAFVVKEINGILHFLVQGKVEPGNFDVVEMAPTVQCLTGNYRKTKEGGLPFLDYVLNASKDSIILDVMQSEEGGRFYKEQNRNIIILADDLFNVEVPDNYCWITLNQLQSFLRFNNFLNIQARSLISAIQFS